MRKLIHSKFELDLSNFKVSDTEDNNWFSDSFFTKYSFPFDIDLIDDLDVAFGFISIYNSSGRETYFEVFYCHGNRIEKAIFEIEQHQQKLSCTVRFGFEQLPSFEKKLSELSLEKFALPVGVDIYEHANDIITQSWPEVNYNFPQIHIDKIDTQEDEWAFFEKIINNRKEGEFLINEVDLIEEISINRNIIQPLPYLLHVLQRGMADANLVLAGDILDDELLKKVTLYGDVEYYKKYEADSIAIYLTPEDYTSAGYWDGQYFRYYQSLSSIVSKGKYRIIGNVNLIATRNNNLSWVRIKYRDIVLFFHEERVQVILNKKQIPINIIFETVVDLNPDEISIEVYGGIPIFDVSTIMDLGINPIVMHDIDGNIIPTVVNSNYVDLTRAVQDMTFGDVIKNLKNWFNYDLDVEGNQAIMNKIESKINYEGVDGFEHFEVKYPIRRFKKGDSYLLKFQDIESKDYTFLPVFQDRDKIVNAGYIVNEKTNTIEINGLPLPLAIRNNVQTAHAFESNNSKMYFVIYDGLTGDNNYSKPINEYLLPAVHLLYWLKWFKFRINSQSFNWIFKAWNHQILNLKAKAKIFCYGNVHIVKTINKTEIHPDVFEVEIDTETLD